MEISVRKATADDYSSLCELFDDMSALHPQGGFLFYTGTVMHGGTNAELAPTIAAQMEREREIRDLQEQRRKK